MRIILGVFLSLILLGCEQLEELTAAEPGEQVDSFLTAIKDNDLPAAYALITEADKEYIQSPERLSREVVWPKTSWEIAPTTVSGDSAKVIAKLDIPDLDAMLESWTDEELDNFYDLDISGRDKVIVERLQSDYVPMTAFDEEFNLVKENGEWRIVRGYQAEDEAHAKEKERRKKIRTLLDSAWDLKLEKKYVEAIEAYNQVLQIDPDYYDAIEEIEELEEKIALKKEEEAYIPYVKIIEFEAKKIDTYSDEDVPAVRFGIQNQGDRTLDEVMVTIYFKDSSGATIYEQTYYPVLVSEYNFTTDSKDPLKPNYIRRQEKGIYYTIKELGPEWEVGSAEIVVAGVKFAE